MKFRLKTCIVLSKEFEIEAEHLNDARRKGARPLCAQHGSRWDRCLGVPHVSPQVPILPWERMPQVSARRDKM